MNPIEIGSVSWSDQEILNSLNEFQELWSRKPIENNHGGMTIPHCIATWFMLKQLQPKVVVESGVWKGLGTWLIRQSVPNALVLSFEIEHWRHHQLRWLFVFPE